MAQLKNTTINGTLSVSSGSSLKNVSVLGNILPAAGGDALYDLGSETLRWKDIWAAKFHGALIGTVSGNVSGNATSADKLNTNAGSATKPVYFANGVPTTCSFDMADINYTASNLGTGKTITSLTQTAGVIAATAEDIKITSSQISDKTTSYDDPNATYATTNAAIKDALSKLETSASGDGFIYGIKQENGKLSITGPTSISTKNPSGTQYLTGISVYNNGRGIEASGASFASSVGDSDNDAPTCTAVKGYVADEIAKIKKDKAGGDGSFIQSISQADGIITATTGTLSGSVSGGNFVTSVTTSGTSISGTTDTFADLRVYDGDKAPTSSSTRAYIDQNIGLLRPQCDEDEDGQLPDITNLYSVNSSSFTLTMLNTFSVSIDLTQYMNNIIIPYGIEVRTTSNVIPACTLHWSIHCSETSLWLEATGRYMPLITSTSPSSDGRYSVYAVNNSVSYAFVRFYFLANKYNT